MAYSLGYFQAVKGFYKGSTRLNVSTCPGAQVVDLKLIVLELVLCLGLLATQRNGLKSYPEIAVLRYSLTTEYVLNYRGLDIMI